MRPAALILCAFSSFAAAAPKTQFVTVDEGVRLEVLDWGGSGRPLVLLAGLGNTAHVFDDFAPKLTPRYHVYGITRRGYGASSSPDTGYSADRLADDVLSVMDQLKIVKPVLIGHSIAGEELSSIGSRHPEKVAGLVYLDAGYAYAFYDASRGDLRTDTQELQNSLDRLRNGAPSPQQEIDLIDSLLASSLPQVEKDLRSERQEQVDALTLPPLPAPPKPGPADMASFAAYAAWQARALGVPHFPESEIRQTFAAKPDGRPGKMHMKSPFTIVAGIQRYTSIRAPILAIFAIPKNRPAWMNLDAATRAALDARDERTDGARADAFANGLPRAKVVRIPHASHYVFLSNEADVLSEIDRFVAGLN